MTTILTERTRNLPIGDLPDAVTLTVSDKYKQVAAWTGISAWYSPLSLESGHWFDMLAGKRAGNQFDQSRPTGAPGVVDIGGTDYANLNGVARMTRFGGDVIDPAEFTIATVYHPNSDTTSGSLYLFSAPIDAIPVPDSSNRFVSLWTIYSGGLRYFRLNVNDTDVSSPGTTFANNVPLLIIISYSATTGWRFRVIPASGTAINTTVASPASNLIPNRGGLQIGDIYLSAGAAYGALGDLYVFDADLHRAANSATLADVIATLTADYL